MLKRAFAFVSLLLLVVGSVWGQTKVSGTYHSSLGDGVSQSSIAFYVSKIAGDTKICEGDSTILAVNVTGTSLYRYQWIKIGTPDQLVGKDSNVLVLKGAPIAGKYFCKVKDLMSGDSIYSKDTLELRVISYPTAKISLPFADTIICYGDTVPLIAGDCGLGHTDRELCKYLWSGVSGKSDTAVTQTKVLSTKSYILRVDHEGCADYDTVKVVVSHPRIDLPAVYNAAEGGAIYLNASCSEESNVDWYIGENKEKTQSSSVTFEYSPVRGPFTVVAKIEPNGCPAEDSCKVLMKLGGTYRSGIQDGNAQSCQRPYILEQSDKNLAGCAGDSVEIYVDVEGTVLTYTWQRMEDHRFVNYVPAAGSHVTGINTPVLKFKPPVIADEGLYRCVIKNECGEVVSDTFGVSVGGRPVLVTKLNKDWDQCLYGTPAELAVYAVSLNNKQLTYKWYKDKVLLSGEEYTKSGMKIPMDGLGRAGLYKVEVSNLCGTVTDSTYLPVNIPAYVQHCDTIIHVCEGGTARFKVEIAGGGVYTSSLKRVSFNTPNPMDYTLIDIGKTGQQVQLPDIDMSYDGQYYAWEVSNHCGGDTSRLIRLVVEKRPELLPLGNDTTLCAGETLRLQCRLKEGTGTIDYKWYKDGVYTGVTGPVFSKTVRMEDAGVYFCSAGNAYCTPGTESTPVLVTVKEKASISKKGIYVESNVINAEGKYCEGTDLTLNVNIPSGQELDSVRWFLNGVRVTDVPGRVSGSNTTSLAIDSVTPLEEGNYTLHLYNGCGENISPYYLLTVPVPARFVKDAGNLLDMTLCQGINQAISVQATGTAPIRFTWTHDNRTVADGYSNTIQLTGVTVDTAGIYCCEIHNGCNPAQRECAEIQVTHPDTFRIVGGGRYCMNNAEGASITLNGSNTNTLYRLYRNGVEIAAVHGKDIVPEGAPVVFEKNLAGAYYVTGEDDENHCEFRMPGDVTIQGDIAPTVYTLSLSKYYCKGGSGATLTLAGSETNPDVVYSLYRIGVREDTEVGTAVPGTGGVLLWKDLKDGDYYVVAKNIVTDCHSDMRGIVNITERPLPLEYELFVKDGKTTYCEGMDSKVELYLSGEQEGVSYVLLLNHQKPGSISPTPKWIGLTSGVYSVYAENIWGCKTSESNAVTVTERPAPKLTLEGGDVYCVNDNNDRTIRLSDLKHNVDYTIYQESPLKEYVFYSAVAGSLEKSVPAEEKDYYVFAVERGSGCEYKTPKISIKKSDFYITTPLEVQIGNGEQASLIVTVHGAVNPSIRWTPADKLEGVDTTATVKTIPLQEGKNYKVTVKDGGCELEKLVKVTVTGGFLQADILAEDQFTSVDTVRLCSNEKLTLYGWYDGGTGSYTHAWYDGNTLIGSAALLEDYQKKSDGYLCYEVKSGGIKVRDSVYVELLQMPKVLSLVDSGLVCTSPASTYTIKLFPRTETDVFYALEYDSLGSGTYKELTEQQGNGGSLDFIISDIEKSLGYYRVKSTRTHSSGFECTSFIQYAELRIAPQRHDISVSCPGASTLCSGDSLEVCLASSEAGVSYHMRRIEGNSYTLWNSVSGTGRQVSFPKHSYISGYYRIYAEYTSDGCGLYLDTLITIHGGLEPILLKGCEDCVSAGVSTGGCAIEAIGMEWDVRYILYSGSGIERNDTLTGPGTKSFANRPAGDYYVIAEEIQTGCRDTMPMRPSIKALPAPNIYPVTPFCDVKAPVLVSGSDGDVVKYTLYRNKLCLTGDTLRGTENPLSFGEKKVPGIYKVWAEHRNGCGVWMRDSVTIYNRLDNCGLKQKGDFCSGSKEPAAIWYDCAVSGWNYYLKRQDVCSDTVAGNINKISWDMVGGLPLSSGTYVLYAYNNCKDTLITSLEVDMEKIPQRQTILTDAAFCGNAGFDIVLADSEPGVIYRLVLINTNGTEQTLLTDIVQVANTLVFKPAKGSHFITAGLYRIYGKYEASCESIVAEKKFSSGIIPTLQHLDGNDVCISGGKDSIILSVSGRQKDVNYYLQRMVSGTIVADSLTGIYKPMPEQHFAAQKTIGCYSAYAVHTSSACRTLLPEVYCLGLPPTPFEVENPGDTIRLCQGDSTFLYLKNSEAGVKYYVMRDGVQAGGPYYGPGRIETMALKQSGIYKVQAENGCSVMMTDSVIVNVRPLPVISTDSTRYHYCDGGAGVTVEVLEPTYAYVDYTLIRPDGVVDEALPGTGGKLSFTNAQTLGGYYKISAIDGRTGCPAVDSIRMKIDTLPTPFQLTGEPGNYICWGESGAIRMAGSTENVRYVLYCNDVNVNEKFGTGGQLLFDNLKQPGIYRIEGTFTQQPGCSRSMLNTLDIRNADSIRRYQLTCSRTSYCYTDVNKSSVTLQGSDYGIEYELYRDGKPTGLKKTGTGDPLTWRKLDGKPCNECVNNEDGYEYRVVGFNTQTSCKMPMRGAYKILQESNVKISWFHPNKDIYICQDSSVDFTVIADGCKQFYRWYQEDRAGVMREIKASNEPYYKLVSARNIDYGHYWCEVSNSCTKAIETMAVEVKVRQKMKLKPDRHVTICEGSSQTVRLEAIYYGTSYNWYKSDRPDSVIGTKQVLVIENVTSAHAGKYVCEASNECYSLRDTCVLSIELPPSVQIISKTDTLCRGGEREMLVSSPDSVEWFLNGVSTGILGNVYTIPAVQLSDGGYYSVKVSSACGSIREDVGALYVDDTIKVLDITDDRYIRCDGKMLDLFIQTTPSDRVNYKWEYLGENPQVIGQEARISYGPLASSNTAYTFRVWFSNKCLLVDPSDPSLPANYRQIRVQVNDKANVEDPPKEIIVCADPAQDTVIRLVHDNKLGMLYSWHFYDYKNDTVPGVSDADTVRIPLQTKNSGYYFCRVNNGCEIVATNACWVRIDTIPLIEGSFADADTLCEGGTLTMMLPATGGSLNYDWMILYKDGRTETVGNNFMADFESTGKLTLSPLTMVHDSALVWCHVSNHCDPAGSYSDTMLLRIRPWREITVEPETLQICGKDPGKIIVTLTKGELPWRYSYRIVGESDPVERNGLMYQSDTLWVTKSGRYKILEISDTTGCRRIHDLPIFTVLSIEQSEVKFTGGGTRCEGDTVSVRFRVANGVGPWQMTIMRESDGDKATEIADPDGIFVMYGRDTTITFKVANSEKYYIYEAVLDLGTGCLGIPFTNRVKVDMNAAKHIDFKTGWPPYIGQCHDINLRDSLNPTINGVPVTEPTASFYVDGKFKNGNYWAKEDLHVGCYQIIFKYTDADGCLVTSDEIQMCVDSLPSAKWDIPAYACEGVTSDIKLYLSPRPQNYTVKLYQHRYSKYPGGIKTDFRTIQVLAAANGKYTESVSWNTGVSPLDSCMRYDIVSVMDSHGCFGVMNDVIRDTAYRDTVMLRLKPEVDIKTRYPHDANWISTSFPVDIIKGDSVEVRARLTCGYPKWSLVANTPPTPSTWPRIYNIPGYDTIFALKEEGIYEFRVKDDICEGEFDVSTVEVTILDTGYFRGRLFLEGPYDVVSGKMKTGGASTVIWDELNLPSVLPRLPAGEKVIDWIEVEVRSGSSVNDVAANKGNSRMVSLDTCLLLSNGQLADRWTGDTIVGIRNTCGSGTNSYYVAVRQRNHLGVMSNHTVRFYPKSDLSHSLPVYMDFTDSLKIYCADGLLFHHMSCHGKRWMLAGGEINTNQLVSIFDPNQIPLTDSAQVWTCYYVMFDINMDGRIDWPGWSNDGGVEDWKICKRNRRKFSDVLWKNNTFTIEEPLCGGNIQLSDTLIHLDACGDTKIVTATFIGANTSYAWEYNGRLLSSVETCKLSVKDFPSPGTYLMRCQIKTADQRAIKRFKVVVPNVIVVESDIYNARMDCGVNSMKDKRDGVTYCTVKVGNQCWMAENINVGAKTSDSDYNTHNTEGIQKICYNNNESYCDKYGGLYSWDETVNGDKANAIKYTPGGTTQIQGICPDGWHVPNDAEWMTLEMALGMTSAQTNATSWRGTDQGTQMKEPRTFDGYNWCSGSTCNKSGFNGRPGGYRHPSNGSFSSVGSYAYFWSATEDNSSSVWYRQMSYSNATVYRGNYNKSYGLSVRCLIN